MRINKKINTMRINAGFILKHFNFGEVETQ